MSDDPSKQTILEGISAFQRQRTRAFWDDIINHLRGHPAELLSFDDVKARLRLREESYQGLQNVPLDKIVGSVGRYRDFTASFLPKSGKMQDRWSRIYAEASGMRGLPPIELYKVGEVYFVRDGNHRVSVAKQMGSKTIEAHVTELASPVNLQPGMSFKDLDLATATANFLDATGLRLTRPHHQDIYLSEPMRYNDLMGHIHLHQRFMERRLGEEVSFHDAAADWYDLVYRPAVTLIRKYDILEKTSKRTESDLYLWLVDHLTEVKAEYGPDAKTRTFSDAIVDFLDERRIAVPEELLEEKDRTVEISREKIREELAKEAKKNGTTPPDS